MGWVFVLLTCGFLKTRLCGLFQVLAPFPHTTLSKNCSVFFSTKTVQNFFIGDVETDNSFLEEKEMDNFLLEAHKKIVSSEIKRRNKEKKNEKNGQGLIQEISSSVPK